jgi:fructose-specific phosphotransferase system IIC component
VYIFGLEKGMGWSQMAKRQQPWWWRSEALGQVAVTLFAAVAAAYLARLLMLYLP